MFIIKKIKKIKKPWEQLQATSKVVKTITEETSGFFFFLKNKTQFSYF